MDRVIVVSCLFDSSFSGSWNARGFFSASWFTTFFFCDAARRSHMSSALSHVECVLFYLSEPDADSEISQTRGARKSVGFAERRKLQRTVRIP